MWLQRPAITAGPAVFPRWKRLGPAAEIPLDIDEIKTWLNRPTQETFFDEEIKRNALAAMLAIEQHCQCVFGFSTWTGTIVDLFDQMKVLRRPFVAVTAISYIDPTTGDITAIDPTNWLALPVGSDCPYGMLYPADGYAWPSVARRLDAVRLTVTAGWATKSDDEGAGAETLPDDVRHAYLMTIAALDANHGDSQSSGGGSGTTVYAMKMAKGGSIIPQEALALLAPYRHRTITVA